MATVVHRPPFLERMEGEFDLDIRHTYFALRTAAGLIALLLPLVLVGWGLAHDVKWGDMNSLSRFYWLSLIAPLDANALLRSWFVGSLIAVGVCLVIYRGYGNLENWLLNFAGFAAVLVALNPMQWPPLHASDPVPFAPLHADAFRVHPIAAITFFLLIAATIWFCARDTLVAVSNPTVRALWSWIYRVFAMAMVVVPLVTFVLVEKDPHRTISIEWAGVWVFSAYWFFKTYELSRVSMVEPPQGPRPQVRRVGGRLEIIHPGSADYDR